MFLPPFVLFVVFASVGHAQETKPSNGDAATRPAVNADDLGVSIDRIRLRFRRQTIFSNVFDPERLRLTSYVDVIGTAPRLNLFGPNAKEELTSYAVPFGAPTHRDMLNLMTPQEFRTPPMDLTALVKWLADRLEKKEEAK